MKIRFVLPFLAALLMAAPPGRAREHENRFLFIIDTSAAMRGYSNQLAQAVTGLMDSDMQGEFRKGDTIGLWTYNDKLHTEFPMEIWSERGKRAIETDMLTFLEGRDFKGVARLSKAMPALQEVVKRSERITVILIFDGAELIHGTPFDKEIDNLQRKYARELQAAQTPFITVLAARHGAIFDYTINYPGLVAIPHTATPQIPPVTNAPVVAIAPPVAALPPKPHHSHSLIMSAFTNVAPAAPPAPAPAPATVIQPPVVVVKPPPQAVIPASPPPAPAKVIEPPVVAEQAPMPVKETPAPQAPPVTAPAAVQTPPPAPVAAPSVRSPPVAVVAPANDAQLPLFIIAFSLLTIAVVLVVFLIRRSRHAHQPSLISQSIDRSR